MNDAMGGFVQTIVCGTGGFPIRGKLECNFFLAEVNYLQKVPDRNFSKSEVPAPISRANQEVLYGS